MTRGAWKAGDPRRRLVAEHEIVETLQLHAWPYETLADPASTRLRAERALDHLVDLGLPQSPASGRRMFDPCEVLHFVAWSYRGLGDSFWVDTCVAGQRRLCSEYDVRTDRRFVLDAERELVKAGAPGAPIRTQLAVPVDTPPQRDVLVTARATHGAHIHHAGHRVDVRADVPAANADRLTIALELRFRTGWQGTVVEPERVEPLREADPADARYLAAFESGVHATERLRRLTSDLTRDAKTPWDVVLRAWQHVFQRVNIGPIWSADLLSDDPLMTVLETGRADCWLASALLVAMCRARGVPARIVEGLMLYEPTVSPHFWFEARIEPYGWLPFDLSHSWTIAAGDLQDDSRSMRFFARLEPRLVIERFPRQHVLLRPRLPLDFSLGERPVPGGIEVLYRDGQDGSVVVRDRFFMREREAIS